MIKTFFTGTLEQALNRLLRLDPQLLPRLQSHQGKIILLLLPAWNLQFYFLITPEGLQILSHYEGVPDTTIKGSIQALLKQVTAQQANTDIVIEGDLELGQQLRDLLRSLDIDWEEHLAKISGDIVANHIGNAARKIRDWGKQTSHKLQNDFTDYLQEEAKLLPTSLEIEEFLNDVSCLRDDVERLEIIVQRMIQ